MRIVLCDDDEQILKQLKKYLRAYFQSAHLTQPDYTVYTSGDDLLDSETGISVTPIDLAFIDVEMPGRNGINTGALLKEKNPNVRIFIVTSYSDYLDDAMKFHVFRYLSKPIDKARLFRNMKEALYQISMDSEKIRVETKEETIIYSSDEIVMIENVDRKVWVHTLSRSLESIENAKYWDRLLKYKSFFRSHRSYIINFKFILSYTRESIKLRTPDGKIWEAYMSRRKYQEFKDAHLLFLETMS